MIEPNATSVATAANILSLINLLGDGAVASTSQSAAFPQAFSALLTEMMGPAATQVPNPSAAQPVQPGTPSGPVSVNKSDNFNPTSNFGPQPASGSAPARRLKPETALTAMTSTLSGLSGTQPIAITIPTTASPAPQAGNFGDPEKSIVGVRYDRTSLVDSKDLRPTKGTGKAAVSNSAAFPTGSPQPSVDRAVAADPMIGAPSEPSAEDAAALETSTTDCINEPILIDPTADAPAEAAPADKAASSNPASLPTESTQPTVGQAVAADPSIVVAAAPNVGNGAGFDETTVPEVNESPAFADSTQAARPPAVSPATGLVQDRLEPKVAAAEDSVQTANPALSSLAESVPTPNLSPDPIPDPPVLKPVQTGETSKTVVAENPASSNKSTPASNTVVPLVPFLHFAIAPLTFAPAVADSKAAKLGQPLTEQVPVIQGAHPELDRAFADVKSFELTVQPEVSTTSSVSVGPSERIPQDQPSQTAIVTTDPVRNLTQQQLPPRIVPLLKVMSEAKAANRSKVSATPDKDVTAASPPTQFTDLVRPVELVDQLPAAHTVEIPNIPRLPVVRIVAMQVGEADSEVTVRIQHRDGNVTLQLNSDNALLHQNLQSSVGSLVQALKLENVPVSGIEVSRKSPIDRVRRMKETL